jgi:hypothetical protein
VEITVSRAVDTALTCWEEESNGLKPGRFSAGTARMRCEPVSLRAIHRAGHAAPIAVREQPSGCGRPACDPLRVRGWGEFGFLAELEDRHQPVEREDQWAEGLVADGRGALGRVGGEHRGADGGQRQEPGVGEQRLVYIEEASYIELVPMRWRTVHSRVP